MTKKNIIKVISIIAAIACLTALTGCSGSDDGETTDAPVAVAQQEEITTEPTTVATTVPETTTVATTVPETTTVPDGSSIQGLIDTLESQNFYLAGTMKLTGGQTMEARANCSGEDYRLDISSSQMKMSVIYFGGKAYIANTATNKYAEINESTMGSLDQMLSSLSSYGISFSSADMSQMKSMMENFDSTMDYSQYINDGEYSERNAKIDGQEYLCSEYKTDYGAVMIYTQNGELKILDVYDGDGLRQMNMHVSAFIPQVVTPISLNGLTATTSILNLFTGM